MKQSICEYCGKTFTRTVRKHDVCRFCSRKCSFDYRHKLATEKSKQTKASVISICAYCGKGFESQHKTCKYCSNECRIEAGRKRSRERSTLQRPQKFVSKSVICRQCGKEFCTEYKKSKNFCSDECKKQHAKTIHKLHKNKKRLEGKIIDNDITIEKLLIRDDNICALCGKEVDVTDYKIINGNFITGCNYPSIDHIIPLSKGGVHSWGNVQLAHFKCNTDKSNHI